MKKQCKRKKWALINPIVHAMAGAAITAEADLNKLRQRELQSIEAFARGTATLGDWQGITSMLNIAEGMARNGIGPEVLPVCEEAQAHLVEAAKRFERLKKMGTTGPGLQSFRDLYEYHDLQRQSVSRSVYEKAIGTVVKRLKSRAPEVTVI